MAIITAHRHFYDVHPNPKFSDMAHCTVCKWGVSKNNLKRALNSRSVTHRVTVEQLSPALRAELEAMEGATMTKTVNGKVVPPVTGDYVTCDCCGRVFLAKYGICVCKG